RRFCRRTGCPTSPWCWCRAALRDRCRLEQYDGTPSGVLPLSRGPKAHAALRAAAKLLGRQHPLDQVTQLAGEDEIAVAENLVRAGLVQVSEEDFRLADEHGVGLTRRAGGDASLHGGAFGT